MNLAAVCGVSYLPMPSFKAALPALLVLGGVAHADVPMTGMYDVKYEEVSTNCTTQRLHYQHGKLAIKQKGNQLQVDIDRTPLMIGQPSKHRKISAKSKLKPTMMDGMLGVFSVAGKVTPEGILSLVMVGEYSANGKPLCTQSWNIVGPRSDEQPSPKK